MTTRYALAFFVPVLLLGCGDIELNSQDGVGAAHADVRMLTDKDTQRVFYLSEGEDTPRYHEVEVSLEGAFALGDPEAGVRILEFGDFQCPWCAQSHFGLKDRKKELLESGSIEWVFVDFSLPGHSQSPGAHNAARCVGLESPAKFWVAHDRIYSLQSQWSNQSNPDWIDILGDLVDQEDTRGCIEDRAELGVVGEFFQVAVDLNLTGTPAYFVGGLPVHGVLNAEHLDNILDLLESSDPAEVLEDSGITAG